MLRIPSLISRIKRIYLLQYIFHPVELRYSLPSNPCYITDIKPATTAPPHPTFRKPHTFSTPTLSSTMDKNQFQTPEQYNQLINLTYQKLPQELFDEIETLTYEAIFCPGLIRPKQLRCWLCLWGKAAKKKHKPNSGVFVSARRTLLCLGKSTRAKYLSRMVSENTLMIGHGTVCPHAIKNSSEPWRLVRKLFLKLSIRDQDKQYPDVIPASYPTSSQLTRQWSNCQREEMAGKWRNP